MNMISLQKWIVLLACIVGTSSISLGQVRPSRRPPTTDGVTVNVRSANAPIPAGQIVSPRSLKFTDKVDRCTRTLPRYEASGAPKPNKRNQNYKWGFFEIKYELVPEWTDEVRIDYAVMTLNEKDKRYSFFEVQETYRDLEKGDHYAAVVLPWQAIERFGTPVAIGVEISSKGKLQASHYDLFQGASVSKVIMTKIKNNPAYQWWKSAEITQDTTVTKRDGYLLDRAKTPFAFINVDDYDMVK